MVQTVYYHLDSNPESRSYNNIRKCHLSEKVILQKNISSNMYVEHSKLKNKQNHCIKLQPLNIKTENNVLYSTEGKFSHQLNPKPFKIAEKCDQKKPSKIPVLQRRIINGSRQKNDNVQGDKMLSAADRRQKFHQSRVHVIAGTGKERLPVISNQKDDLHQSFIPWYNGFVLQQVSIPPPISKVNQKNILPPIKAVDVTVVAEQKASQPKNKCLLGEITHFPALCNPSCIKRQKNCYVSSVPHLPPILPPPAAPPPSISTSLEQDGNQVNGQLNAKTNNEWNPCKSATPCKLIAV